MKLLVAGLLSLVLASSGICSQQNIVVVFDASGSMGSRFSHATDGTRKIDAAKTALKQILSDVPENTNVGLVVFGSKSGWFYKLGMLDKPKLQKAIDDIQVGGGTPLGKYMKIGANALLELRAKQKSGVYKLIVVTDGESDDNIDTPLSGQYGILSKGIVVEAIGVDMSSRHTLATNLGNEG
jgi:Ca-activated chloride channel family protein